ncbi:MAG: hypothetical protein FWD62_04375 [Betaproteobacteria bacterium]|nr:hypothetical protein [Betaproteobacteria bacterium]
MGWLDRWRKRAMPAVANKVSDALVRDATAYIVKLVDPRLALCPRYAARLERGIRIALAHCIEIEACLPPLIEAGPGTWAADPQLAAFFVSESELQTVCSRSAEVQTFFSDALIEDSVCAVLSTELIERQVSGVALVDGALREDVLQVAVSFSNPRVRIVATDLDGLRRAVGKRAFEELASIALARSEAESAVRQQLDEERALLATRRQMLARAGAGLEASELKSVEAELDRNAREMARYGGGSDALERRLEDLATVLEHAAEQISLERRHMRLTATNRLIEGETQENVREIEFALASSRRTATRAFILIRLPRTMLCKQKLDLDHARSLLI